ncbi:helix-turn-helix transcriptional regulator [Agromyces sp. Leaf222]|uniref:helix-turn-helix domain-containing protein n=1 Tax=Agromyces sp. Leaf222 TaxID=1735688 RepID=UPI0012F8817E|nr:helix-turn-helix transcriptional regulator [Agromyces sp. Leaf222]
MGRTPRESPRELTSSWPDVPCDDPAGEIARQFVLKLVQATDGQSIRAVAEKAGVNEGTIRRVIAGESWPDLRTIARVEISLKKRLYRSSAI